MSSMAIPVATTSPQADQVQVELLRRASPATRAARALSLSATVIELARHAIRERHPDWSEDQVAMEFVAVHYGNDLADRVRAYLERMRR